MEKIESFKVNHLTLLPGLYVSRRDFFNNCDVTTFDIRYVAPNREPVLDMPAVHTIEHLGATYLRNSKINNSIIYFGPMGCRTGFYLVVFGKLSSKDIYKEIVKMCNFILSFEGEIPGAKPEECGNYLEHNLNMAKLYTIKYLEDLKRNKRFVYSK